MSHFGFVRVAAAVPRVRVADCQANADAIAGLLGRAAGDGVDVIVFPELCLTGYTCADLFGQRPLLHDALAALARLAEVTRRDFAGLAVVGLPVAADDQLYNCAAVLHRGRVLGVVPKSHLPNYQEFYEDRWFSPAPPPGGGRAVSLGGPIAPFGTDLLFAASDVENLVVGVEICEDLWTPVPPSCGQALGGATLVLNPSASNETIGKAGYRRQLVGNQSARCVCGYAYAGAGVTESTTDLVFGGHCLIAENGSLLAESPRFGRDETLLVADLDVDRLHADRLRTTTFADARSRTSRPFVRLPFATGRGGPPGRLLRAVAAHPFVPSAEAELAQRCDEIFQTQVAGLATRLEHAGRPAVSIGVSGGLDSTLALVVTCKTFDLLGVPRERVKALTMPGFGTTGRTLANARELMRLLGVSAAEVDIRGMCLDEWRALGHRPFGIDPGGHTVETLAAELSRLPAEKRHDLVFENVQARRRTALLMNAGFTIGTGDLSELALGWCTYNADHMSMYNPNASIPKTLVKFLVSRAARHEFEGEVRRVLLDIVDTEITPELLPTSGDGAGQPTEATVGPYELVDFFLYHLLRYGFSPSKVLYLASHAKFDRDYTAAEVRHWLGQFLRRFFASQYKRSALPDGPKVGSVSLSPRGDWRMPSDAHAAAWLRDLEAGG
jgi:NAD+ synthase (glutamine-hydrolysing)